MISVLGCLKLSKELLRSNVSLGLRVLLQLSGPSAFLLENALSDGSLGVRVEAEQDTTVLERVLLLRRPALRHAFRAPAGDLLGVCVSEWPRVECEGREMREVDKESV